MTAFAKRMVKARDDKGLTQQQVCDAIDIPQSTLAEIETKNVGNSKWLLPLARLYGEDPDYLRTGVRQAIKPEGELPPHIAMLVRQLVGLPLEVQEVAVGAFIQGIVILRTGKPIEVRRLERAEDASPAAPQPTPPHQPGRGKSPTAGRGTTHKRTSSPKR